MNSIKLQLLNQISVSEIYKFYLPDYKPGQDQNCKSPFSKKDEHASLSIYEKDGQVMFKSHNTGHQGDVFQFVADLKKLDCKVNFREVIDVISKDIGLNLSENLNYSQNIAISYKKEPTELVTYFSKLGVSSDTLAYLNVNQIKYHEFITKKGKLCKFDYIKLKQLAICYSIENRIKVYIPKIDGVQDKYFGFKDQQTNDIFGFDQVLNMSSNVDRLFVCAGEKDSLVLYSRGFHSISFQSENTHPTKDQIKEISAIANEVFIVYDPDEAGRKASSSLSSITGWKIIYLPNEGEDVSDYFQKNQKQDFEKLIENSVVQLVTNQEVPNQEVYTIFHQTEDFLKSKYDFRYNTVSLDIEVSVKNHNNYIQLNENNLFVELNKSGIKVGMDKLICILKSNFVPLFNPIVDYFKTLPDWDNIDHIGNLAAHLHAEQQTQLYQQFKKWLVRCVKCAIVPSYYNKQAFILVHSAQNSGKTSFCRFLCPPALSNYIAENISDDKDSRIALVKNFMINLDELSSLARHEINSLKAVFSKDCINERLPYDRKNSIIPRIANFIGSTNMSEFLADETGSVRWLCFEIHKIDWNYSNVIDINKVWAQAYSLFKSGFYPDMTPEDIAENERRNSKFQQRSAEAEIIPTLLEPSDSTNVNSHFMTATDILNYLTIYTQLKLNKIMIGRAMPNCGFKRVKDYKSDSYGYWCIKLKE